MPNPRAQDQGKGYAEIVDSGDLELKSLRVTSPTDQGFGYGTGAGGAATQITSITTGVTLSKPAGKITTVASTLAAGAEETFTVTNTLVDADDMVIVTTTYAGAGTAFVYCSKVAAGSFDVTMSNLAAAAALNAVLVINFVVIKNVVA